MEHLDEGILNKIADWANKINPQNAEQTKDASALSDFIRDPKMQRQMQIVAVEQLVKSFAATANKAPAPDKKKAVQQFYNTWKTKTDPTLLQAALKKYKLL